MTATRILPEAQRKWLHVALSGHALTAAYHIRCDRADLASAQWLAIEYLCLHNGGVQRGAAS